LGIALWRASSSVEWSPLGLLVALCGGLWWKARQEERVMSSRFPDAYAEYKKRVHAIIPFFL
jgi:protein-S-isoprenylcysteine O-methyltransferase Ste14